jgi:microcystin-dependent protein
MSNPYLGEVRIFGFNFAPLGWATCDGQILSIAQNTALFSLLGTNYGGNGTTTFGLPNFQGDTGVNQGQGPGLSQYFLGQQSGTTTVTLNQNNLPSHNHVINTRGAGVSSQGLHAPTNAAFLGNSEPDRLYNTTATPTLSMAPQAIGPSGQGQAHDNMQPYEVLLFCIALRGVFPPRS